MRLAAYRRLPRGLAGRPRARMRVAAALVLASARLPRVACWWPAVVRRIKYGSRMTSTILSFSYLLHTNSKVGK
jgi:hypothetical protein